MAKTPQAHSRAANWSLWLGIGALLFGWIPLIGWSLVLAAIITGAIGINDTADGRPGRGKALAGLIMGVASIVIAVATTALIAALFFTISSSEIHLGATSYDNAGDTLVVTVSGLNQNRTISEGKPIHLHVEGINNTVYVADGTSVLTLTLQGVGNTASLPSDTRATYINEGINNHASTR